MNSNQTDPLTTLNRRLDSSEELSFDSTSTPTNEAATDFLAMSRSEQQQQLQHLECKILNLAVSQNKAHTAFFSMMSRTMSDMSVLQAKVKKEKEARKSTEAELMKLKDQMDQVMKENMHLKEQFSKLAIEMRDRITTGNDINKNESAAGSAHQALAVVERREQVGKDNEGPEE
jgi:hypothetical protein